MENSSVAYEVDYNNCLKSIQVKVAENWKKKRKKSREDKKITGLSQHMKITDHSPAWDDVRIIYREKNGKRESSKKHLKQHHIRKNNWWIKKMKER